jgi:hypothetical protein
MPGPIISSLVIQRLTEKFALPTEGIFQDWDIEVADAARLEDFLRGYDALTEKDDRCALMCVIFASYDDYVAGSGRNSNMEERIRLSVLREFSLHLDTIEYWARSGFSEEESFHISEFARNLLSLRGRADA